MPKTLSSSQRILHTGVTILQSGILLLALTTGSEMSSLRAQTPAPDQALPPVNPITPATDYTPLTDTERWRRYVDKTLLSPELYLAALSGAGWEQLENEPPEWRQGVAGYARRSASLLGTFAMEVTIHEAGAAALGYDPRYSACDCHGFFRRSGHAILWSFITRNNQGSLRPDLPAISAAYGSGMLSMYWYPARFSPLTDGVRLGSQQVGAQVGLNWIREFTPEFRKVFGFKH
jgi:hypothetical protein